MREKAKEKQPKNNIPPQTPKGITKRVAKSSNITNHLDTHGAHTIEASSQNERTEVQNSTSDTNAVDDWCVTHEMPGGPVDGSVIPSYGGHVARRIWEGIERDVLSVYTRPDSCRSLKNALKNMKQEAVDLVNASGLRHLPDIIYTELDMPLITAFVERWQPDTNSFHLPFGEMTILLHDVCYIMKLSVEGELPCESGNKSQFSVKHELMRLFGYEDEKLLNSTRKYHKGGVDVNALVELCTDARIEAASQSALWLLAATGVCLFTDKYRTHVKAHQYLNVFPDKVGKTSWAAMVLAYLYRQLGQATRFGCIGIAGCLTLLQAWIYEHFHCFRPNRYKLPIGSEDGCAAAWHVHHEKKDSRRLLSLRQRLDALRADEVTWCPYVANPTSVCERTTYHGCIGYFDIVEPYMPDRCIRQLGYVQKIPMPTLKPVSAIRPTKVASYVVKFTSFILEEWEMFGGRSRIQLDSYTQSTRPDMADTEYSTWYTSISHPLLIPDSASASHVQVDQTSCDWWAHEFYRLASPLTSLPSDQIGDTPQWRELTVLLEQFGNMRGFRQG